MNSLSDKIAVITGAANGIGRAALKAFASQGAVVVAVDVDEDLLSIGRQYVDESSIKIRPVIADVTQEEDVKRVVNSTVEEFGRIDILYNNVGGSGPRVCFHEMTLSWWEKVLRLNLWSVFLMSKYAIPFMSTQGEAVIINTASQMGLVGAEGLAAYNAAKAGVINLTRSLAAEYGPRGIRVNCLCPGATETKSLAEDLDTTVDAKAAREAWMQRHLLMRFADPIEIAEAAVFLASDASRFMTGSTLVIDGGYTAI